MSRSGPRSQPQRPDLAIFLPSLAGGGAERMMLNLARGAVESGICVDLVLASAQGPYLGLVPAGCRLEDLGSPRVLAALPALVRYLRRRRPLVMLAAMDHANLVALWARALARVPTRVFVSVRSPLSREATESPTWAGRWLPRLARVFYPRAQAVIAVSRGVADDLERLVGTGRARVVVIPNPVVTPELGALMDETPAHPWAGDPEVALILAAGRLSPQKDFATLIRAFALLHGPGNGRGPLRLLILGEGPERPRLESLIRELGLGARVALPGFTDNPFAYMARAGLFVLSSAWEGLPGVLIQALACGTPVVSTDCPSGPREVLQDGRLGPLVPVAEPGALAAAMAQVLDHPPDPDLLRSRAANYGLVAVTRRYLDVMGLEPKRSRG